MMTTDRGLRQSIAGDGMIVAPGGHDGVTAKLIEQAGFPAVYMGGSSTSARFGFPDYGLLTMTEMVDNAAVMVRSVQVPVIADADTGYGNELNVVRAVREFEMRGVAAIHLEDQGFPKRCGHLDDKELIPCDDFVAKIRAAVWARRSPDFLIIARTDARAQLGLDAAISRANAALEAGADMAFVEAPETLDEVAAVPAAVRGPCVLNVVRGGKSPHIDLAWAEQVGYKLAIVPGLLLKSIINICEDKLQELRHTRVHPVPVRDFPVTETFRRLGSEQWDDLRTCFRSGQTDADRA